MATIRGRGKALGILLSLVLLSVMALAAPAAHAASLTGLSLTLDNTAPGGTGVSYTFAWTGSGALIKGVKLEFCTAASGTCSTPATDFSSTGAGLGGGPFSAWTGAFGGNGTITATDATGDTTTGVSQVISGMTNTGTTIDTTPTVFYVRITTYSDVAMTAVVDGESVVAAAVIPAISVSATQDAILQLTVSGVSSGTSVDTGKTTTATSTATTLPFGNFLAMGITSPTPSSRALAHTVNVVTNGVTGYTAQVQGGGASAMTRSGSSDTIGYVTSDIEWDETSPTGTTGFGVSATGGDAPSSFDTDTDSALEYEPLSSALTIASDTAPTAGADTTVIFRVQVNATTAAGDYGGTINYTVLPNF